jgi:hypothetical protein
MALFFEQFPKLAYDISGNKNFKLVTDIFRRIKIRSNIADNVSLYSTYDVPSGETPETTSFKHFGTTDYHWIILMTNNITDRYYGWPLNEQDFEAYVVEKYDNPSAVHHYEITQSSGTQTSNGPFDYSHKIEVNSTEVGAEAVSNYEYERRLQDEKRNIKLLDPNYLPLFLEEFEKLTRE